MREDNPIEPSEVEACYEQANTAMEKAARATTERDRVAFLTVATEWLTLAEEIQSLIDGRTKQPLRLI